MDRPPLDEIIEILNIVQSIAGGSSWQAFGPNNVQVSDAVIQGITVFDPGGGIIPAASITPGTYTIDRIRVAVATNIVAATPSSKSDGTVYVSYAYPGASWAIGDISVVTLSGVQIIIGGITTSLPPIQVWARIVMEPDIDSKITTINTNQGNPAGDHLISTTAKLGNDTVDLPTRLATLLADILLIPTTPMLAANGALEATLTAIKGIGWTTQTLVALMTAIGAIPTTPMLAANGATAVELAKVPKSDSNVSWNTTALAAIVTQVIAALNTIAPATPITGSLLDILSKAAGANTFVKATDSLEAIADAIAALNNLSQSQILSDATPFPGADIPILVARKILPMPLPPLTSDYQAQVVLTAGAGNKALPSIAIPANFIPVGATVVHGYIVMKFSGRENTSASVNSISGAQNIQAENNVGGAWVTSIAFAGGEYSTGIGATIALDAEAEGDVIFGKGDIAAQVPANGGQLNIQWTNGVAAFANLDFDDCQFILTIWVTVP